VVWYEPFCQVVCLFWVFHSHFDIVLDDCHCVVHDSRVGFWFFLYFELLRENFSCCANFIFEGLQSPFSINDAEEQVESNDTDEVSKSELWDIIDTVLVHEDAGEHDKEDEGSESEACGLPVSDGFSDAYFLFPVLIEHVSSLEQHWQERGSDGSDGQSDDETCQEIVETLLRFFHCIILLCICFTCLFLLIEAVDVFGDDISVTVFGFAETSELVVWFYCFPCAFSHSFGFWVIRVKPVSKELGAFASFSISADDEGVSEGRIVLSFARPPNVDIVGFFSQVYDCDCHGVNRCMGASVFGLPLEA